MKHSDFQIGTEFYTGTGKWRCTDVGTRVIVAMKLDPITVTTHTYETGFSKVEKTQILTQQEAEVGGWLSGPPYTVGEDVFDEFDLEGCYLTKEEVL